MGARGGWGEVSAMDVTDATRARQEELRRRLTAIGFDEVRFASLRELGGERLNAWLAAGHHADMQWMERTAEKRLKPELVQAEARSVVMLGVSYAGIETARSEGRATWARYALHEDYHDTMKVGLIAAERDADLATARELAFFGDDFDAAGVFARCAGAAAGERFCGRGVVVREVHAVFGCVPDAGVCGAGRGGCAAVCLLSDH